jgi:hypothetical protein
MPKSDQKVSFSAALQRPQRQKALPKPVAKEQPPREDEISDGSVETSLLKLDDESSQGSLPSFVQISQSQISSSEPEVVQPEPKPKKVITYQPGTVVAKAKPKLKPKDLDAEPTQISEDEPEAESVVESVPVMDQETDEETKDKPEADTVVQSKPETLVNEVTEKISEPTIQDVEDVVEDVSELAIASVDNSVDNSESSSQGLQGSQDNEGNDPKKKLELINHDSDQTGEIASLEEFDPELVERSPQESSSDQDFLESAQSSTPASSIPIFWCQAVGVVSGRYVPGAEVFQKGEIITESGLTYKTFVLSKAVKSLEKKTDLSMSHDFVVYPKTSRLHGVRFEILATDLGSRIEELSDRYFNIRGLVTKHREDSVLIEIQRRPEFLRPAQSDRFTLEIKGEMPVEMVQQFVFVKCELVENYLRLISYEHLACAIAPPSKKTEKPVLKPKVVQTATDSERSLLDQN